VGSCSVGGRKEGGRREKGGRKEGGRVSWREWELKRAEDGNREVGR
jgi:hypothetical protein